GGTDHQVGRVETAELLIEIGEAGGDADRLAVALEGGLRQVDRAGQRLSEFLKPALGLARRRQREQLLFGAFDLGYRRIVEIVAERLGDDILADRDQFAPQM